MKLVILRGLPASGKSTYAMELVRQGYARVNKDELRLMLFDIQFDLSVEPIINTVALEIMEECLEDGYNVVSDNTNMPGKFFDAQLKLAEKEGAEVEIKYFDVDVEECVRRDRLRGKKSVGEKVIRQMDAVMKRLIAENRRYASLHPHMIKKPASGPCSFCGQDISGEYYNCSVEGCHNLICSGCDRGCDNCFEFFCRGHLTQCAMCWDGYLYCDDCLDECKYCGRSICGQCRYICEKCKKVLCGDCAEESGFGRCSRCGLRLCGDCHGSSHICIKARYAAIHKWHMKPRPADRISVERLIPPFGKWKWKITGLTRIWASDKEAEDFTVDDMKDILNNIIVALEGTVIPKIEELDLSSLELPEDLEKWIETVREEIEMDNINELRDANHHIGALYNICDGYAVWLEPPEESHVALHPWLVRKKRTEIELPVSLTYSDVERIMRGDTYLPSDEPDCIDAVREYMRFVKTILDQHAEGKEFDEIKVPAGYKWADAEGVISTYEYLKYPSLWDEGEEELVKYNTICSIVTYYMDNTSAALHPFFYPVSCNAWCESEGTIRCGICGHLYCDDHWSRCMFPGCSIEACCDCFWDGIGTTCDSCGALFCSAHYHHCDRCENSYCEDCFDTHKRKYHHAAIHPRHLDVREKIIKKKIERVWECDIVGCSNPRNPDNRCITCGAVFCDEHGNKFMTICKDCSQPVCDDESKECKQCGGSLCKDCYGDHMEWHSKWYSAAIHPRHRAVLRRCTTCGFPDCVVLNESWMERLCCRCFSVAGYKYPPDRWCAPCKERSDKKVCGAIHPWHRPPSLGERFLLWLHQDKSAPRYAAIHPAHRSAHMDEFAIRGLETIKYYITEKHVPWDIAAIWALLAEYCHKNIPEWDEHLENSVNNVYTAILDTCNVYLPTDIGDTIECPKCHEEIEVSGAHIECQKCGYERDVDYAAIHPVHLCPIVPVPTAKELRARGAVESIYINADQERLRKGTVYRYKGYLYEIIGDEEPMMIGALHPAHERWRKEAGI